MQFEVFIPSNDPDGFDITLIIGAENWMQALKLGLQRTGEEQGKVRNVLCDIKENNSIHVTDLASRRVFKIREIRDAKAIEGTAEPTAPKPADLSAPEPGRYRHPMEHPAITTQQKVAARAEANLQTVKPDQPIRKQETPWQRPAGPVIATTKAVAAAVGRPPARSTEHSVKAMPTGRDLSQQRTSVSPPSALDVVDTEPLQPAVQPSTEPEVGRQIQIEPEVKPNRPVLRTSPAILRSGEPLGIVAETGSYRRIGSCEFETVGSQREEGAARILKESVVPTRSRLPALSFLDEIARDGERVTQSDIEDVFLEIMEMFEGNKTIEEATAFSLDLAMGHISAESGSVLYADETGMNLYFAAARGPKAPEILERDFIVPITLGIVGFCAREGVSVAVSEVRQDPRFYKDIAEAIGHDARSILCSPIQYEGRAYGAIELVNHRRRDTFEPGEMNILAYIAEQTGEFIARLLGID